MFEHNRAPEFALPVAGSHETVGLSATALAWYLIRTKSGKEQYVHKELSRRLPETFMPMLETRSRRRTVSLVPLFPQYLFARLELAAHYFEVRYFPGVVGFISAGCEPLAVTQTVVDNVRSRCTDGVVQIPQRPFRHGQHVRIISGPFCDFDAIFEHYLSGSKRVAILISTVERSGVRVVADAASIAT
jgi:transcription elongation factor/antiterminator RfaH